MPIPRNTPKELHPAMKQLSQLTDLVHYQDFIGRKTRYGDKSGPEAWTYTRQYATRFMPHSNAEEIISLLKQVGAENDIEAAMHVANSLHLIP
jgi:hypothetical protein